MSSDSFGEVESNILASKCAIEFVFKKDQSSLYHIRMKLWFYFDSLTMFRLLTVIHSSYGDMTTEGGLEGY